MTLLLERAPDRTLPYSVNHPDRLALTLVIVSGLFGVLEDPAGYGGVGMPIVFGLGLARYTNSRWVNRAHRSSWNAEELRRHGNLAARRASALLYALFAVKAIQYFLLGSPGGLAFRDVMHGLWPYLAAVFPSLVLARMLGSETARWLLNRRPKSLRG